MVEAIPDELMGEQTWPAESEMADGDVVGDSESKSERKAKVMTNYDGDIYYCFVKVN